MRFNEVRLCLLHGRHSLFAYLCRPFSGTLCIKRDLSVTVAFSQTETERCQSTPRRPAARPSRTSSSLQGTRRHTGQDRHRAHGLKAPADTGVSLFEEGVPPPQGHEPWASYQGMGSQSIPGPAGPSYYPGWAPPNGPPQWPAPPFNHPWFGPRGWPPSPTGPPPPSASAVPLPLSTAGTGPDPRDSAPTPATSGPPSEGVADDESEDDSSGDEAEENRRYKSKIEAAYHTLALPMPERKETEGEGDLMIKPPKPRAPPLVIPVSKVLDRYFSRAWEGATGEPDYSWTNRLAPPQEHTKVGRRAGPAKPPRMRFYNTTHASLPKAASWPMGKLEVDSDAGPILGNVKLQSRDTDDWMDAVGKMLRILNQTLFVQEACTKLITDGLLDQIKEEGRGKAC